MELSKPKKEEIAGWIEAGMICYYHKKTGETEIHPDMNNAGVQEDFWQELFDKIEADKENYAEFRPMHSSEAYQLMVDFAHQLEESPLKHELLYRLDNPKPFHHFKHIIDDSPQRSHWFDFRLNAHKSFVEKQWEEMESGAERGTPRT